MIILGILMTIYFMITGLLLLCVIGLLSKLGDTIFENSIKNIKEKGEDENE